MKRIELVTNNEWILNHIITIEDESMADDAANEWYCEAVELLERNGFDVIRPIGQRSMYHAWNGSRHSGRGWIAQDDGIDADLVGDLLDQVTLDIDARYAAEYNLALLRYARDNFDDDGQRIGQSIAEYCNAWDAGLSEDGTPWARGGSGVWHFDAEETSRLVGWMRCRDMIDG